MYASLLVALSALGQPFNASMVDPRHHVDSRCFGAVMYDAPDSQRDPALPAEYLWSNTANATIEDCARACCGDWSCIAFAFYTSNAPDHCGAGTSAQNPCCAFIDGLAPTTSGEIVGRRTGRRQFLSARMPAHVETSTLVKATIEDGFVLGIDGDEFPTTWGADGSQYTGAGDNQQPETGSHPATNSPLSFFRITASGPEAMNCSAVPGQDPQQPECQGVSLQGDSIPVRNAEAVKACPAWFQKGVPNMKSSSVISIDGVLYWAVSCFNYGDDDVFNRQRYGPAWIITSTDGGVTFNLTATPTGFFPGRLSAPRFLQHGQDNREARDGYVYAYFPCANGDSAFFENNDMVLLGRVPKAQLLVRSAWQFYMGLQSDGAVAWTTDSTIAQPVLEFPLMTSVQQVNWHEGLGRYVFANWAWVSMDGNPRPDHTGDESYGRTVRQRTQLLLVESPTPWGPFSVFFRDDNWHLSDDSRGAYTPVFPPAWMHNGSLAMVSTQCCGFARSSYTFRPINHYNFIVQNVTLTRL